MKRSYYRLDASYPMVRQLEQLLAYAHKKKLLVLTSCAGTGKSKLLNDYLEKNGLISFWFTVDKSSKGLADFTRDFSQFVKNKFGFTVSLDSGDKEDVYGIVNRLSVALAEVPAAHIYIVIDNFHLLAPDAGLLSFVHHFINNAHPNIHFLVLSNRKVQLDFYNYSRLSELMEIDQRSFLLSAEEIKGYILVNYNQELEDIQVKKIYDLTDGWLVAVDAVAQALTVNKNILDIIEQDYLQIIRFLPDLDTFLTNNTYWDLPLTHQELFLSISVVEEPSLELAERLAGHDAVLYLKELDKTYGFATCRDSLRQIYKINRIWQSFFYNKALQILDAKKVAELHNIAAVYYMENQLWRQSINQFLLAGDLQSAALVLSKQPIILDSHLIGKLHRLIKEADPRLLENEPWIQFAYAMSIQYVDPELSAIYIKKAWKGFCSTEELEGQIFILCQNILISTLLTTDWDRSDACRELTKIHQDNPWFNVCKNITLAFAKSQITGDFAEAIQLAERCRQFGLLHKHENIILWSDWLICAAATEMGNFGVAKGYLLEALEKADLPEVDYRMKTTMQYQAGHFYLKQGDFKSALHWFHLALSNKSQDMFSFYIHRHCAYVEDNLRNFEKGYYHISEMQNCARLVLKKGNHHLWCSSLLAQAEHHLICKNTLLAQELAEEALADAEMVGAKILVVRCNIILGAIYRELGQYSQSLESLNQALEIAKVIGSPIYKASCDFHLAILYKRQGDQEKFEGYINRALSIGAKEKCTHFYGLPTWEMKEIINSFDKRVPYLGYIQELNERLGKTKAVESIRIQPKKMFYIRLLGPFSIDSNDRQLGTCTNKALYLLKLLAVVNSKTSIQKVIEELWPDWDQKLAMNNYYAAVHQLRKYLGDKSFVKSDKGLCWLDKMYYTTDLAEFDNYVSQARKYIGINDYQQAAKEYESALMLYRGELLEGDNLGEALFAEKVDFERRHYNAVIDYCRLLIKGKEFDKAVNLLNKLLTNPFADDDAYRLIMIASNLSGNHRQAIQIYNKLKSALLNEFDAEPHPLTTKLYTLIKEGQDISSFIDLQSSSQDL